MDRMSRLEILRGDDGDVHVTIYELGDDELVRCASVEFCAPGVGGGASPKTHAALLVLAQAMEADG